MQRIKSISGSGANAKITLTWPETGGGRYGMIKEGDTVSFYDVSSGKVLGSTTVKSATNADVITLNEEIPGLKEGVYVAVDSLAAPNSQVINCDIKGTLRFRAPAYIVDSRIHCTRMWLAFEGPLLEGPIPQNILFHNCDITFDDEESKYIDISTAGSNAKAVKDGSLSADEAMRVKNIVFEYCRINANALSFGELEDYCTDTVTFVPGK